MTLAFYITKEPQIWSLSLYGVESDAVPLSSPPRGLENVRCVDWICSDFLLYLFSGFVGFRLWIVSVFTSCLLSLHLFGFLQHIFSLSALLYLLWISICVFELVSFLKLQQVFPK